MAARMAIAKEGYFELERGRYGPIYPRTRACYGFSIIAKVKAGEKVADVGLPVLSPRGTQRPWQRQDGDEALHPSDDQRQDAPSTTTPAYTDHL
jgi:hypothetical protein